MYLAHFGLDEPPFRITPHTEFFFEGAKRGATLEGLIYAITHDEGIVKVTGEVGSGKTMLCRVLLERMPESVEVLYLANPSVSRDEILDVLAADLKAESESSHTTIRMRALQERLIGLYAQGRRVVVLIDEAHAMPLETLEEIRLLSNLESNRHKLLQIVLFALREANEQLALPNMRQLRERITHSFRLEPLVRQDIEKYIDFRMRAAGFRGPNVFSAPALRAIVKASQGLTRRINILADKALLAAFADGTHEVTAKHARAAIQDSNYKKPLPRPGPWAIAIAALVVGIAIGFGVRFFDAPIAASAATDAVSPTPTEPAASPAKAASDTPPLAPLAQQPASVEPQGGAANDEAQLGPLARERYDATQSWLDTAPAGHFTIHLMTATSASRLEYFLAEIGKVVDPQQLHVYGVKHEGKQRYAVAYGLYPSVETTITAMGNLPAALKAKGPYHRSVVVMRRQNAQ